MKKLVLCLFLFVSIQVMGQTINDSQYVQLSSVYYITPGHSNLTFGQRQCIWDQGRYLSFINPDCKILLKAYSSDIEYGKYGNKLLQKRIKIIKNLLITDCNVDSSRFIVILIGNMVKTNNNPVANQRVDIEIIN